MTRRVTLESCRLHHETHDAILVSVDGDRDRAQWLPKAAIEFERKRSAGPGSRVVDVTLPERMAVEKELV